MLDFNLLINADNPTNKPQIFHARERGLEYRIYHYNDQFYIQTNLNAQNFCLMTCPENKTGKENWKIFISHRNNTLIEYIETFESHKIWNAGEIEMEQSCKRTLSKPSLTKVGSARGSTEAFTHGVAISI